jgi:hypothetical protein
VCIAAWGHDNSDAFSETIAGGAAEIQRNIIAGRVLGCLKALGKIPWGSYGVPRIFNMRGPHTSQVSP